MEYIVPPIDDIAEPLADGSWINSKIARLIEIIRERYPDLDVVWIPRERRAADDAAFAIVETLKDGRQVVALYIKTEAEFNESILERLIRADMLNKDPQKVNAEIEAKNEATKLIRNKKQQEQMQEVMDPYLYALRSGKHKYMGEKGKRLYYDY